MKKLLVLMLAVLMCLTLAVAVACEPEVPGKVELDIAKGWKGNDEEVTYSVSETNGTVISYEKSGEWQYCRRVFLNETPEDLAKVKTLVMTGKMSAETHKVTLKFEYNGEVKLDEGVRNEVTFTMSETEATYEWDVSKLKIDQAARILLFAEGSRKAGNGTITISKMILTEDAITEANDVTKQKITIPDHDVNEITDKNHSFNANWYDSGDEAFTATTADGKTTVKKLAGGGWASLRVDVKGAEIANMKSLRVTFKGAKGDYIIVKPFDNGACEAKMEGNVTGGLDTIVCDITPALADFDATKTYTIFIMYNWDAATPSTFTIESAEFSATPANAITAENGDVTRWYDNGDGNFTLAEKDGKITVTKAANGSWSSIKADVIGSGLATNKYIRAKLSDVKGDVICLKIEGNGVSKEVKIEPASTKESVEMILDLSEIELDVTKVYNVLIMFNWDATEETSLVIDSVKFSASGEPTVDPKDYVNDITAASGKVINWYDDGANKFTVVEKDGRAEVSKVAGGGWTQLKVNFSGEGLATRKYFRIVLSGIKDDDIIVKYEKAQGDAVEAKREPSATDKAVLVLDLNKYTFDATKTYNIMIFFAFDDNAPAASFVIESAEFTSVVLNEVTAENGKVSNWYDGGDGVYTVAVADGKTTVTRAVVAQKEWAQLKLDVTGAGLDTRKILVVTLSGMTGDSVKIKYDNKEVDAVVTGDTATARLDLSEFTIDSNGVISIMLFSNWEAKAETSFVIESAEFVAA